MNTFRFALSVILAGVPALANAGWIAITSIPTLDDVGLIVLAVGVGGLGAWLLSRKKK